MTEPAQYNPRILIADDEPFLRAELREALAELWPEARVVAEAGDGIEALRLGRETQPDVAFLDIRMPGLDGIELAHVFSPRTHVVFVTAFGEHAVDAFDEGAVDYVMKPASGERLARAVERLRARIAAARPGSAAGPAPLTCLQASVGQAIHFIDLADVVYFCADAKYTRVVTEKVEAHIRLSLKELADTLDRAPSGRSTAATWLRSSASHRRYVPKMGPYGCTCAAMARDCRSARATSICSGRCERSGQDLAQPRVDIADLFDAQRMLHHVLVPLDLIPQ